MNSRSSARKEGSSGAKSVARLSEEIKTAVLGEDYELSLVFCGNALSRKLNLTYRGKDKPTNVLSFPLSKSSGEIFINTAHLDGFSELELFIHGLLHLKGMEHSARMEREEQRFLKLFINGKTALSRDRYRNPIRKGNNRRRG